MSPEGHPLHALQAWLSEPQAGRSMKSLVFAIRKRRRRVSEKYLEMVASGYYAPSRKLILLLSEITGIPAEQFVTYPYRSKRSA